MGYLSEPLHLLEAFPLTRRRFCSKTATAIFQFLISLNRRVFKSCSHPILNWRHAT